MTVCGGCFDFSVFGCLADLRQTLLKSLHVIWLSQSEKIACVNAITAFKLFDESKQEIVAMADFQLVYAK